MIIRSEFPIRKRQNKVRQKKDYPPLLQAGVDLCINGERKNEKKDFFMDEEGAVADLRPGWRSCASAAEQLCGTGIRRACAD